MLDGLFLSFRERLWEPIFRKNASMQTERAKSIVELDGKQAVQMLDLLKGKATDLKAEMAKAFAANDLEGFKKAQQELKTTEQSMKNFKKASFDADAVLQNLSGSTLKELQKAQSAITNQLRGMARGTDDYVAKSKDLQQVRAEIAKVKGEMNGMEEAQGGFLSRTNNFIGKWGNMIAGAAATFAGLALSLNKFKDYALDIEDAKANLSSLTGLKGADLESMGQSAEKMSTSTTEAGVRITKSAKDILDAYTLMGSAKPELLGNKEALNQVTKEALTLAEAAKMDTTPAVESLATVMNQFSHGADQASSDINVLAAGSQAGAEGVDGLAASIKNFGPAAVGANVSLEKSVALVETLSEKGVKGAESGTGIRNFLLTLQSGADDTNPKLVGLEKALDNLAAKNMSASQMVKLFGKENYVTSSIIINNRDRVNELTKAVTGTSVAYQQAGVNTNTTRAKLAQTQNEFMLQAKTLGEKLAPAMSGVTNIGTKFLKLLVSFPQVLQIMSPAIIGLTAAWITYQLTQEKEILLAKSNILWNNALITSFKKLYATIAANPYAAIVAGAGLAITAIIGVCKSLKDQRYAFDGASSATETFTTKLTAAKTEAYAEFAALSKTTEGTNSRRTAIHQLNEKYGSYLTNMLTEKSTLSDIKKAQDEVINGLTTRIFLQSKEDEIAKAGEQYLNRSKDTSAYLLQQVQKLAKNNGTAYAETLYNTILDEMNNNPNKSVGGIFQNLYKKHPNLKPVGPAQIQRKNAEGAMEMIDNNSPQWNIYKQASQILNDQKEYKKIVNSIGKQFDGMAKSMKITLDTKPVVPVNKSVDGDGDVVEGGTGTSTTDERYSKEQDVLEKWVREQQNIYKQQYLDAKLDKEKFNQEMIALEVTRLVKLKALAKKYGKDISQIEGQLLDNRISDLEKTNREMLADKKVFDQKYGKTIKSSINVQDSIQKAGNKSLQKNRDQHAKRELDASKNAGEERSKQEQVEFESRKASMENFQNLSQGFSEGFGSLMGEMIVDQQMSQAEFANGLLTLGLDALHNVVRMAIAQIWAQAMATPDSIATFGASGIAKATIISLLAETAFGVAKAALKKPTAQRAEGKYDVLATDGNTYRAQIVENPGTGIYSTPTLFAEKGGELIVDNSTLNRVMLQSPWVLQEIQRLRVPQRAEGKYDSIPTSKPNQKADENLVLNNALKLLIDRLNRPFEAKMISSNFKSVQAREDAIRRKSKRK